MGAAGKTVKVMVHPSVDGCVFTHVLAESFQATLVGELPVDTEHRRLEKGGVLGQLLDRITAVAENPLFPIDEE